MNKRTVMASLNKIANELDNNGLHNEADTVTKVMSRLAYDDFDERDYYNDKMDDMDLMKEDYMPYGDEDDDMDMEEDDDMGFESEPFDYSSPEDEGDMYGDDMTGYMDKDTDF
jgi:hypothetical protein